METVIKLDRISKEYDGINILNNINLDIKKDLKFIMVVVVVENLFYLN